VSFLHRLHVTEFDELADLLRSLDYNLELFGGVVADMAGLTSEAGPDPVPTGTKAPPTNGA
jgi:hypothetical protein